MYYTTTYTSPVGHIKLASDEKNLIGLWLEEQKYFGSGIKDAMAEKNDLPVLQTAKSWLDSYFKGNKPDISTLPLAPVDGEFRQNVWKILCEIPYGTCITYGDIAKTLTAKLGKAQSARAVGGAVGHNPISIIIPCHRVVGANGHLTGYAGGVDKKVALLTHEGVDLSRMRF